MSYNEETRPPEELVAAILSYPKGCADMVDSVPSQSSMYVHCKNCPLCDDNGGDCPGDATMSKALAQEWMDAYTGDSNKPAVQTLDKETALKSIRTLQRFGGCVGMMDNHEKGEYVACSSCPLNHRYGGKCDGISPHGTLELIGEWIDKHNVAVLNKDAQTTTVDSTTQGRKFDQDKARYDLVPFREWEEVVKVLTLGAKKYAPENWKFVPDSKSRYIAAAFRHLVARCMGEINDKETGLPHTAHCICCLLFLMWHDKETP